MAYHNLSADSVYCLVCSILYLRIPIRELDLSGNDVGSFGCKLLNVVAQRIKTFKSLVLNESNI